MGRFNPLPAPGCRRIVPASLGLLFLAGGALQAATSTSTAKNPAVTFATPGSKLVTLQVCNSAGCHSITQTVVVLNPKPQIASATIPPLVATGQTVTLQAMTTGRPPLTHQWIFSDGVTDQVVTGNPVTWSAPSSPGTYQAHLAVTNADGSAASPPVTVSVVLSTFADVPPTYWAWRFIENLFTRGISNGCGSAPRVFCPENSVSRAEMAVFLLLAKEGAAFVPPPCSAPLFADVPCSNPFSPWINELVRRGVTAGCGGGNFCPTAPVTRAEMAVFLLVTKEGPGFVPAVLCFPVAFNDVPCSSPFAPWIQELVNRGVSAGCGGGNYCPFLPVSRAQMSIFLSANFNLPPPP